MPCCPNQDWHPHNRTEQWRDYLYFRLSAWPSGWVVMPNDRPDAVASGKADDIDQAKEKALEAADEIYNLLFKIKELDGTTDMYPGRWNL